MVFLAKTLLISKEVISAVGKIRREFTFKDHCPKIKHEIICNPYEKGGLKNVDINLQSKKFLMEKLFICQSILNFNISKLKTFADYYRKMVIA